MRKLYYASNDSAVHPGYYSTQSPVAWVSKGMSIMHIHLICEQTGMDAIVSSPKANNLTVKFIRTGKVNGGKVKISYNK